MDWFDTFVLVSYVAGAIFFWFSASAASEQALYELAEENGGLDSEFFIFMSRTLPGLLLRHGTPILFALGWFVFVPLFTISRLIRNRRNRR